MNSAKKGVFFVIASAVIFGFTPVLTRFSYDEGTNGVTMTFLRAVLALPFLFAVVKIRKIPFATSRAETLDLFLAGLAAAVTTILLYVSYAYIPVGEAMTLHFIYPALVSAGCVVFYKDKLTKPILTALALSVAGVFMVSDNLSVSNMESGAMTGFVLAVASGFTFALYVVYIDKSSLRRIPAPKAAFYLCVMAALCSGVYGGSGFSGGLAFAMSLKGWVYAWVVALSVSLVAIVLLQLGIKYTNATTAAILLTFEPITSVLSGALFLGESLSFTKITGCACIVAGVILVARSR
jgi:drug/metabolite transporter (DMT)-like permease